MKKIFTFFIPFLFGMSFSNSADEVAARALLQRIAPQYNNKIIFKSEPSSDGKGFYQLENYCGKLLVTGNNANSMAVGFNYFLKNYCKTNVSWFSENNIFLPEKFPEISEIVRNEAKVENRFFLNYCTFGYTMPWWKWKDWERFIDWMALNGVNLPLAITGQEKVWLNVWKKFGLSDQEIREFFTGPAYLPWHRMANIDSWEGPLPMSWINGQAELQTKILERERELNMKPVLPAFGGHVPKALKEKFPNSKIISLGEWGDFDEKYQSYFLDSFDPLFTRIQDEFLKEQTQLFGTDHIYGTDPFNEVTPPSWEPQYLADVSRHIYESITATDKNAQWLQMTWIFYYMQDKWTNERIKAFLRAVPQDKMILLDYYCDHTEIWKKTESFYGQPYIWCYLGNFGGNTSIKGNLKDINDKIDNVLKNGGGNLWGLGATLEGFGNNPLMYELVLDKAWTSSSSLEGFVQNYAYSRVGNEDQNISEAWKILSDKIYIDLSEIGNGDLTHSKPVLEKSFNWTVNPQIKYNNRDLLEVWKLLLAGKSNTDTYHDDLTVVGVQVLGNYFPVLRNHFTEAYRKKDLNNMKKYASKMQEIIADMDKLLSSNNNYLVGKWIDDARKMTDIEAEKSYYEKDARKIISVWGEQGRDLNDYANRSVAGLMKDYYGGRWKILTDEAIKSVEKGNSLDEKNVLEKVNEFSWNWSESQNFYPSVPKGKMKKISMKLYQKYSPKIQSTP